MKMYVTVYTGHVITVELEPEDIAVLRSAANGVPIEAEYIDDWKMDLQRAAWAGLIEVVHVRPGEDTAVQLTELGSEVAAKLGL